MKKSTIEKIKKDTRGAISILLACLMLPFFSLSAMLIEMGRYQSAVNALDSALGSSAYSTLSNYDSYLFERFGLLSTSQSSEDTNADLTGTMQKYLGLQKTVDMRGVEVEESSVNGLNCLAEIEILKQQIQNYSAVIGPTKAFMEGFDINSIIGQLEKSLGFTGMIKQLTSGFNLISKEVAVLEAYDDAKKQMKEVKKAETTYNSAFSSWQGAVQSLVNHLETECPDSEEDKKGYEKWHEKKSELQSSANTAKSEYVSAISSLISQLETLQSKLSSAATAQEAFETQIVDFAANSANSYIDETIPENADKEYKNVAENFKKTETAIGTVAKSANSSFSNHSKGFSIDRIKSAITGLYNEKSAVSSFNSTSTVPSEESYHYVNLNGLTDEKAIDQMIEETEQGIKKSGGLDILLSIADFFNAIFKTEFIADGRLNAILDTSYYEDTIGGLPSKVSQTPKYSFLAEDERRSHGYLAAIDPDFDPNDPYGLVANSLEGKFNAVMDAIDTMIDSIDDLKDADWLIAKLKAAVSFGTALLDVAAKAGEFISFMLKEIVTIGYERFLSFMYLAYNLPNRTNFASGATFSGYSFAKISRPMTDTGTNIPIAGDIIGLFSQTKEYSFIGAELEYIIWGNRSEMINQSNMFWILYLLRLAIDLPQVIANAEVQQIMNTLNAVPYIGPILGIGFVVIAALSEPMCDTIFLVNGASAEIIKKTVYITPSGLPNLVSGFISLGLSNASKEKLTKKACDTWGISIEDTKKKAEGAESPVDNSKKPNESVDLSKQPAKTPEKIFDADKYKSGLLKFNYTEHCLFLMILAGSEKTYLKRLADLIQCEMTMRNHYDKASITNQITGEYKDFNIYHAYSTIRVQAKGKVNQLLPFPQLSDVNVFDRTLNRIVYRGY